jgi:hypothetical protein
MCSGELGDLPEPRAVLDRPAEWFWRHPPHMRLPRRYAGETAMGEQDRRRTPRVKTFLRGFVTYDDQAVAADCLVRDISDAGAKLELSENVVIPYLIDLYIPKKDETLRANVLWRYGDLIGVGFRKNANKHRDGAPGGGTMMAVAQPSHEADLAARLQRIETEIALLRRAIKNLSDNKIPVRLPI